MMDIHIEPLKKEELYDLAVLFEIVWRTGLEDIYKKAEWSFGNSHSIVLVAKHGDKLVGARGATVWPLTYRSQKVNGLQFHDTCVHPEYRRLGIISRLNNEFIKYHSHDYDMIFNVSVDTARKAYEKLGWKYLNGFRRLTKVNNRVKAIVYRKHLRQVGKTEKNPAIHEILFNSEILQARKQALQSFVSVDYDVDFLKWRLSNTSVGYKAMACDEGVVVYKIKTKGDLREMVIGEVFLYKYELESFRKVFKKSLEEEKPDIIYTYLSVNHPCYHFYIKSHFLLNPLRLNLNFGTRRLSETLKEYDVTRENMAFTNMDLDTF